MIQSLFFKQTTTLDFNYLSIGRGLIGRAWCVDDGLIGTLNQEGMVYDFGNVKQEIRKYLNEILGHPLLVPSQFESIKITSFDLALKIELSTKIDTISYIVPKGNLFIVDEQIISQKILTPILERHLIERLSNKVENIKLALYPQKVEGPYYHYIHSLRTHQGVCQFIAHGHRSEIEIYVDEVCNHNLEPLWVNKFLDIYIAA